MGHRRVAPHAGAWIETLCALFVFECIAPVAPHAGAWIETPPTAPLDNGGESPLMQGRGLKLDQDLARALSALVAPHAGAWIETKLASASRFVPSVAPHAGAWIETLR